jgi:peptidoglycan/LPS O-acetylase OafA/YrhL
MIRFDRRLSDASDGHANSLDFFRFVFACLVIITHSFVFVRTDLPEPMDALTRGQMSAGAFAVYGFFLISGFLITASWFRSKGLFDYAKKRVLRIHPAFIVCCVICVFLVQPLGEADVSRYFAETNWLRFVKNALFLNKIELPDVGPIPFDLDERQVNGSLWTIKIEFECYVLVALLGVVGLLRRASVIALGLFAAWALFVIGHDPALLSKMPMQPLIKHFGAHFHFLTFFLFGALFYVLRAKVPHDGRLALIALAIFVLGAATRTGDYLFPPAISYGILYLGFHPKMPLRDFAKKRDLSYGVYLYGWPIQFLVAGVLGRDVNVYLFALICLPLACGAAALSWKFVEAPALRLKSSTAYRPVPQTESA